MKIGLLGGTFDPIHIGHLVLAMESCYQLALDKIIFVPVCIPPLKESQPNVASALDRLNMVRLALGDDARFGISTFEIDKGGMSYSIDTIKYFNEIYKNEEKLFFLVGADSIKTLSRWKDVTTILDLVDFVIATRPGWDAKDTFKGKVRHITIPAIDVSSTIVRERILKGLPIDYLVPPGVVRYIHDKGLYSS